MRSSPGGTRVGFVPRNPDPTAVSQIFSHLSWIRFLWEVFGVCLTGPALVQKNQKSLGVFTPKNASLMKECPAGVSVNSRDGRTLLNSSSAVLAGLGWLEMTWTLKVCHPSPSLSPSGRSGWDLRLEEPPDPGIPGDSQGLSHMA